VALLLAIHKFPVSYFNPKSGCPDYIVIFLSAFSQTADITSQPATTVSSHVIFKFLQTDHATFARSVQ
jgi:hypothetical protein